MDKSYGIKRRENIRIKRIILKVIVGFLLLIFLMGCQSGYKVMEGNKILTWIHEMMTDSHNHIVEVTLVHNQNPIEYSVQVLIDNQREQIAYRMDESLEWVIIMGFNKSLAHEVSRDTEWMNDLLRGLSIGANDGRDNPSHLQDMGELEEFIELQNLLERVRLNKSVWFGGGMSFEILLENMELTIKVSEIYDKI